MPPPDAASAVVFVLQKHIWLPVTPPLFETQIHTTRSRHSPKYFGLKKGITNYTGVANHVPFNARIIGANESESHYVYDIPSSPAGASW
jgi:hypothetical protein